LKRSCDFKKIEDNRGLLVVFDKIQKFDLRRFYIIECNLGMWRGNHYHKDATQLIGVINGQIEVELISKESTEKFVMSPGDMFLQNPGFFFKFQSLDPSSSLIVLCDKEHNQSDYYTSFQNE
jgi:dTDP-4-dehydrorhamnose 3,5-epimerase-like enzyme